MTNRRVSDALNGGNDPSRTTSASGIDTEVGTSETRKPLKKRNFDSVILLDHDSADDDDDDDYKKDGNHVSILEAWAVVPSSEEKSSCLSTSEIATLPGDAFLSTSPLTNDFNTQMEDHLDVENNDKTELVQTVRETTPNVFSLKLTKVTKNNKDTIEPARDQKQQKRKKDQLPSENRKTKKKPRSSKENKVLDVLSEQEICMENGRGKKKAPTLTKTNIAAETENDFVKTIKKTDLEVISEENCSEKVKKNKHNRMEIHETLTMAESNQENGKKNGKGKKKASQPTKTNAASETNKEAIKKTQNTVKSNVHVEKKNADMKNLTEPELARSEAEPKTKSTRTPSDKVLETKSNPNNSSGVQKQRQKKMTFEEQVFNHMLAAFKPFTLKSLAKELNTTDTILKYSMLSLIDKGLVTKKDFGKNKELYWANQQGGRGFGSKEIRVVPPATEKERQVKQKEMLELQHQVDAIKSQMELILQQPSNSQLETQLQAAQSELEKERTKLAEIMARIANRKSAQTVRSSKATHKDGCHSPRRLKLRINALRNEWKTRKEKVIDFVELVADGMEKKPKEIYKLLDIETDEDANVTMPPKHTDVANSK